MNHESGLNNDQAQPTPSRNSLNEFKEDINDAQTLQLKSKDSKTINSFKRNSNSKGSKITPVNFKSDIKSASNCHDYNRGDEIYTESDVPLLK